MSTSIDGITSALADRYLIERQLGEGGMATVYLAEDLKHRCRVAVKVLKRRWLAMPEFVTTAGPSYTLTRDGRVVYVRGSPERAVQYLRVVPNWVGRMKQAVDEASQASDGGR